MLEYQIPPWPKLKEETRKNQIDVMEGCDWAIWWSTLISRSDQTKGEHTLWLLSSKKERKEGFFHQR